MRSDGARPADTLSDQPGVYPAPVLTRIDRLLERRFGHRPMVGKLVRYSAASGAGIVASQVILQFCFVVLDFSATLSNVIAVTIGAIPNYTINRAWTWGKRGDHSLSREVVPFWAMAALGLVLSTIAVTWTEARYPDSALAVSAANLGAFGVLWVAKFFVLDKVLFAGPDTEPD